MSHNRADCLQHLVATAILHKYGETSSQDIEALVASTVTLTSNDDKDKLIFRLKPIRNWRDDVRNQTILLVLIDRYLSKQPKLDRPLATLNRLSFGSSRSTFRKNDYVKDFGGKVPTPKNQVCVRLDELERLCSYTLSGMEESRLEDKALMLAHIFGSLIRIHPFRDGNGRTARLFAFYALSCWRLPMFPIPKVRNDPQWRAALESAVAGNAIKLKHQFVRRIEKALKSD